MKMRKFDDLQNADELREELIELLIRHDVNRCEYQTDIYLYEEEDGSGRLEEFVNVGGNSWLDDDHMLLTVIPQRYDSIYDYCEGGTEVLAGWCGLETSELINQVSEWLRSEYAADDIILYYVTFEDCVRYVSGSEDLDKTFTASVEEWIRSEGFCRDAADNIIERFDDNLADERRIIEMGG